MNAADVIIIGSGPAGAAAASVLQVFEHRRFMLIGVAAPVIVGRVWALVDGRGYPGGFEGAYFAIRILIPLALLFTANRCVNRIGLALIPLVQVAGLFR